jgi:cytochrome c-type biogenesis protein
MLPVYFIYLAGNPDEGSAIDLKSNKKLIVNSIGFVIGFTLVFTLLGATVTSMGQFFTANKDLLKKISGIVMILLGLNFTGLLDLNFLNTDKRIEYKFNNLGFANSIIFGIVFSFGWTPCVGTFLGSALALASNADTISQGILLLLVYSVGLGIPFILSSILLNKIKGAFTQIQRHSKKISIFSGILLIITGIAVYTDRIKYLNYLFL